MKQIRPGNSSLSLSHWLRMYGHGPVDEAESLAALHRVLELGINFLFQLWANPKLPHCSGFAR